MNWGNMKMWKMRWLMDERGIMGLMRKVSRSQGQDRECVVGRVESARVWFGEHMEEVKIASVLSMCGAKLRRVWDGC
jgi:hypothetical protein